MRIAIGNIVQESNSFSPVLGSWDHFPPGHLLRGEEVIMQRAGTRTEIGGAIDAAREQGITLVPLIAAMTSAAAGPMLADVFTPVGIYLRLRDRFRDTVLLESTDSHVADSSFSFIGINAIAGIEITSANSIEFKLPGQEPERVDIKDTSEVPGLLWSFMQHFEVKNTSRDTACAQGLYGYTSFDAVQFFDTVRFRDRAVLSATGSLDLKMKKSSLFPNYHTALQKLPLHFIRTK